MARIYKETWANSLLKLCETRLSIADEKAVLKRTWTEVCESRNVVKIRSQSEREVATDMTIITIAKERIRLQHPTLYQVLEIIPDSSFIRRSVSGQ